MPTITLTLPTAGTVITAGLHSANYSALQTLLNGGLDTGNWASGKIFAPSKLMQEGATSNQVLQWNGSQWAPATGSTYAAPGYATTLPGSPTDGQEAILVDSLTLPTFQWRFRWNNGSSNTDKWEFVGGIAAFAEVTTAETTSSTTYAALATAGPSFTVPRAGVYLVEIGYRLSTGVAGSTQWMSYDIGGTGAVDADGVTATINNLTIGGLSRVRSKSGLAASTALVSKYKTSTGTAGFADRWMRVSPVRVS